MLDLSPRDLAIVQDILRKHVPDRAVWAFGSRVRGTARRYSDLDLAIIADTPLPLDIVGSIREDFADSDLPFRVDILDWGTASDPFRRVVEQDRIVLQPAPIRS
nr:nucleotidyltransferase domain-containing protein [uncultured Rhodopila sp.]